jgi:hypothetical protein
MVKKSHDELAVGALIRVKVGTTMPEFPDVACGGWTGKIVETSGKKPNTKYFVEWDDTTLGIIRSRILSFARLRGSIIAWPASTARPWSRPANANNLRAPRRLPQFLRPSRPVRALQCWSAKPFDCEGQSGLLRCAQNRSFRSDQSNRLY